MIKIKPSFVIFFILILISMQMQSSNGQSMNLLQRYLKQYFKGYYPNTIRSYTLVGNGQSGPAEYQAGLPVPLDQTGQISTLIYGKTSVKAREEERQQEMQQKAYENMAAAAAAHQNQWVYPAPPNNYYPGPPGPNPYMDPMHPQASENHQQYYQPGMNVNYASQQQNQGRFAQEPGYVGENDQDSDSDDDSVEYV